MIKKYLAVEATEPIKAASKAQFMAFASSLWDKIESESIAIIGGSFDAELGTITFRFVEESPWWVKLRRRKDGNAGKKNQA